MPPRAAALLGTLGAVLGVFACSDTLVVDDDLRGTGGAGGTTDEDPDGSSDDDDSSSSSGGMDGDPPTSGGAPTGGNGAEGGMGGRLPELPTCTEAQTLCEGRCVDPTSDVEFCGASCEEGNPGVHCADDETCVEGACELTCAEAHVACAGKCVDPVVNDLYCGASGACESADEQGEFCDENESCVAGSCASWSPIYHEPEGTAPFTTAIRKDGLVLWAMRKDNQAAFRTLASDQNPSAWRESTEQGPPTVNYLHVDASFTGEGDPAVVYNTDWGFSLGLFDAVTFAEQSRAGKASNNIPLQLLTDRRDARAFVIGDNPAEAGADLWAYALGPDSEDLSLDFLVSETAEAPGSSAREGGLLASSWRDPDHREVRTRFAADAAACCDSERLSSETVTDVSVPRLTMDEDQNVVVAWAESTGAAWHLRSWQADSSDEAPNAWHRESSLLSSSISTREPLFALESNSGGTRVVLWVDENEDGRLGSRHFDPIRWAWTEPEFLEETPYPAQFAAEHRLMDAALNEAGLVSLAWVDEQNVLWCRIYKPEFAAFGPALAVTTEAAGVQRVETQIDAAGRVFVFWENGEGALAARWLR